MHLTRALLRIGFCLAVLFPALLQLSVPAQAELRGGARVALVIGNGAYRNVDRLANAGNDARLVAATLQKLGFTLVGGGPQLDLDRARLAQAVQDFGRTLQGAEVGLFYYSGHGLQVQGVNWLVPVDANPTRPQDLDFQMVDADLVLRQMDGAGTRLNLVMLDACRNNPFASRGIRAVQAGLAEMRAPEGTLISYATQPGSVAADGAGGNSPYTAALAASMQQPGVDIFRMFNQVGLQVKRATGGNQQPWVSNSPIEGDFYFAGPPPTPAPVPPTPGPQVAGLVQSPAAPPALPAPQPEAAAPPPEDAARLLALANTLASAQPCAILDVRASGGGVSLSGFARAGPDWDNTMRQITATRGLRPARTQVEFVQDFACATLAALAGPVRATRQAETRPMLSLDRNELPAGAALSLLLRGAEGKAVTLDLFRPNGTVQHVAAPAVTAVAAGSLRIRLPMASNSVPGPRLLVVTVSDRKLELGERPHNEDAAAYLKVLQDALGRTADARVDLAGYELKQAATAPPPRPAARLGRCAAILERAQLGEALSDADRAVLRTECR